MTCSACHGKMLRKTGDLDLRINGELYIVHNVPFEECDNCGERVVAPSTSENIYKRIRSQKFVREKVEISTFDLAANL